MQPTDLADPQQTPEPSPAAPTTEPPASATEPPAPNAEPPAPNAEPATDPDQPVPTEEARPGRVRRLLNHPRVSPSLTVLACVIVFVALLYPNILKRLSIGGFARIPIEAALGIAILILLPRRSRVAFASVAGAVLGWLIIEKSLDMGWFQILARPFDPVLDWVLFDDTYGFIRDSYGQTAAYGAVAGVVIGVVLVLAVTTWAVLRVAALVARHRKVSAYTAGGITAAWVVTLLLGVQIVPNVPVAARTTVTYAWDRAHQARAGLADEAKFAAEVAADPYRNATGDQMLAGLRGKDVIFTFVESYGRNALETPGLAEDVSAVLERRAAQLQQAGFAARSGWLTSPTFGGSSWLAHSTLLSGLWINSQSRYRNLTASERLTVPNAFKRGGWDTVSVMPGATRAWPEGNFYGYNRVWDSRNLGYQGPKFSWAPMPDQYTLKKFTELEYAKPGRRPLMVEMPLVSSHTPWTPIPSFMDWEQVGDGSIYHQDVAGAPKKKEIWGSSKKVRAGYGKSVRYTLTTLLDWVQTYGDENLVLVFLGDHQPSTVITGDDASHDVPITVVARDQAVLDRISSWNWTEGLKPAPDAPVWPMNAFRDRFFAAFGSGTH